MCGALRDDGVLLLLGHAMLDRAGIYRAELESFMGCGSFLLFRFSGMERGVVGPICYGNGAFAGEWEYKRFFKFCVCVLVLLIM